MVWMHQSMAVQSIVIAHIWNVMLHAREHRRGSIPSGNKRRSCTKRCARCGSFAGGKLGFRVQEGMVVQGPSRGKRWCTSTGQEQNGGGAHGAARAHRTVDLAAALDQGSGPPPLEQMRLRKACSQMSLAPNHRVPAKKREMESYSTCAARGHPAAARSRVAPSSSSDLHSVALLDQKSWQICPLSSHIALISGSEPRSL